MVFGVDDVAFFAAFTALKYAFSKAIKVGSDWYVDMTVAQNLEALYIGAKGTADRRRRPWPTIRKLVEAYKTGDKNKFRELREALHELKDRMTEEYQEALAEHLATTSIEQAVEIVNEMLHMID